MPRKIDVKKFGKSRRKGYTSRFTRAKREELVEVLLSGEYDKGEGSLLRSVVVFDDPERSGYPNEGDPGTHI